MIITTKKGDKGTTSLANGQRVDKDNLRIELNGEIDELSARMGWCKLLDDTLKEPFSLLQQQLITMMAIIAQPDKVWEEDLQELRQGLKHMENVINQLTSDIAPFHFLLPGKDARDAALHLVRTQTRTCERRMVALNRQQQLPTVLLEWINRLSDYLFALTMKK